MSFLRLTYSPEDDWHGELRASSAAFGFMGEGSAWFTRDRLLDFARGLDAFPLPSKEPVSLSDDIVGQDGHRQEAHLRLDIALASPVGLFLVEVGLVAEPYLGTGYHRQKCHIRFLADQASMDRFRTAFVRMVETGGEVELPGLEC